MTTNSYTTVLANSTDAEFRAWGLAFKNSLTAVGLTNTADTGQIDFTTVTLPGAGSFGGYEIWRFNDASQATSPIFIRFDYGTNSVGSPQINVRIGVATDGAGNFVGLTSAATALVCADLAVTSAVTPFATYMTYSATVGTLCIAFKLGACGPATMGYGFMSIGRSCNSSGAPTTLGATLYTFGSDVSGLATAQSLRFTATAAAYTAHQNYAIVVGDVIGSAVGSDVQAYLNWAHYPQVEPINYLMTAITDEFPRGTTFVATLVGATPRTYLALGLQSPRASFGDNITHYSFAMLYE